MKRGKRALSVLVVMCVISQLSLEAFSQPPRQVQRTPQAAVQPQAEVKKMEKIAIPQDGLVLPKGLRFESTGPGTGTIYMANNQGVTLTCNCKKQKAGKGSCAATYNPTTKSVKCTVKDGCQACGAFVEVTPGSEIAAILLKAVKAQITTADPRAARTPLPTAELKQTKRMAPGSKFKLPDGYTFQPKGSGGGVIYLDNRPSTVEFSCECSKRAPGSKKGSCSTVFDASTLELYCVPIKGSCADCSPVIIWEEVDAAKASLLLRSKVAPPVTRR
jgi:hypothetical protein